MVDADPNNASKVYRAYKLFGGWSSRGNGYMKSWMYGADVPMGRWVKGYELALLPGDYPYTPGIGHGFHASRDSMEGNKGVPRTIGDIQMTVYLRGAKLFGDQQWNYTFELVRIPCIFATEMYIPINGELPPGVNECDVSSARP
jgi:hypothetical protein